MGKIISSRANGDDKVLLEIEVDYIESLNLKGHINNVHVFSEDAAQIRTNMSQRGTNEATKYFLIPRVLRNNIDFDSFAKCQRIDMSEKSIFVFIVDLK